METIKLVLQNYTVILKFKPFDEEIDIDDLTMIHYENLSGEVITISALLNRIGLLKAEAENEVSKNKHQLEILAARKRKYYRGIAIQDKIKLTSQQLEDQVLLDKEYQDSKTSYIDDQRVFGILESLYWAVNAKSQKLSVLMKGVVPEEFVNEIVEGAINGMMIKKVENLIQ